MPTTTFNPFDYLETQDEMNEFLRECSEDDDPNVFVSALEHLESFKNKTKTADRRELS